MIEIFKGNTLLRTIETKQSFNKGDELHIKIFKLGADKPCYENVIEVPGEQSSVELEIPADVTKNFQCINLILDITLVTKSGYVKTNQYKLIVKSRCIHGQ
jgi:hypothetical protein